MLARVGTRDTETEHVAIVATANEAGSDQSNIERVSNNFSAMTRSLARLSASMEVISPPIQNLRLQINKGNLPLERLAQSGSLLVPMHKWIASGRTFSDVWGLR